MCTVCCFLSFSLQILSKGTWQRNIGQICYWECFSEEVWAVFSATVLINHCKVLEGVNYYFFKFMSIEFCLWHWLSDFPSVLIQLWDCQGFFLFCLIAVFVKRLVLLFFLKISNISLRKGTSKYISHLTCKKVNTYENKKYYLMSLNLFIIASVSTYSQVVRLKSKFNTFSYTF